MDRTSLAGQIEQCAVEFFGARPATAAKGLSMLGRRVEPDDPTRQRNSHMASTRVVHSYKTSWRSAGASDGSKVSPIGRVKSHSLEEADPASLQPAGSRILIRPASSMSERRGQRRAPAHAIK